MEPKASPQVFYRWVDAQGRQHVVSSLDSVPLAERARAERVELSGAPVAPALELPRGASEPAWRLEPGSFGLGFGAALVLTLLFRLLPSGWRGLTRVAVVLGAAALLTGLYLGALRRTTGGSDAGALATPSALIDDAKAAVKKLEQRQQQQDQQLRELEAEGR